MKLRAEKELNKPNQGPQRKASQSRPIAALLSAAAIGAVLAEGCSDCPVDKSCNASDYDIELKEGESKGTVSNGKEVHVEVLEIYANAKVDGAVCRVYGGGARLHLTIDGDPPVDREVDVSPSMCFSVVERCVGINDVSVDADVDLVVGDGADGGTGTETCVVSNKKVSFTLTIGE